MAVEEIKYDVVKDLGNNIEIRQYAPVVIAEVTVEGTRSEAPSAAFRTLFDYISGNNIALDGDSEKIPMTAPVSQQAVTPSKSEKIPMTAPVTQEQLEPNVWKVAFYMPEDMPLNETPKPKSDKITIREAKFGKIIALRFSGRGTDSNVNEHDAELKAYMKDNNIKFNEADRVLAFYNSPFTPWFLRRNEVLYPMKWLRDDKFASGQTKRILEEKLLCAFFKSVLIVRIL